MSSRSLILLAAALWCGACAPVINRTPVSGVQMDVSRLVGEWQGDYNSVESGRRGLITFRLRAGADTAEGDVIMQSRNEADPSAQSRGQVFRLDEVNRRAGIVLNANLGFYSFALGSAQRLDSGNYVFNAGYRPDATGITVEMNPQGEVVYALESSAPEYRTFRLRDMYNP